MKTKNLKILFLIAFLLFDKIAFSQGSQINPFSSENKSFIQAIIASFAFQGTFLVMSVYMFLLYIQNKKKDYLFYGLYLLIFASYLYIRIELTTEFNLLTSNRIIYYHLLTPLNFLIASFYVKFINIYGEIEKYNKSFALRLDVFYYLFITIAVGVLGYTLITDDFNSVEKYQHYIVLPMHIYTLVALIRAFVEIKSKIRYYVLFGNVFLLIFSAIGYYNTTGTFFSQDSSSHDLLGFYTFNYTQFGAFLEMVCFSLGLGYKFNLIEKEKDEVKQKYIVQLKENEIVTRQLNEELTELVAERTKELEHKTVELEEEQDIKSRLYENISHEFRTPLTLISGPIQTKLNDPKFNDDEIADFKLIKRNTDRLVDLTEQLLELSRLEKGKMILYISKGNMGLFLKNLAQNFVHYAKENSISFKVEVEELNNVWYDKDIIEKITTNLISNALKHNFPQGSCFLSVKRNQDQIEIFIENTSKNVSKLSEKRIFNRFYQVDENIEGTGLGLSLVNELVKLYGGTIKMTKKDRLKINFNVLLPINKSAFPNSVVHHLKETLISNESNNEPHYDGIEKQLPLILIVEDHLNVLAFIKSILIDKYNIVEAENGQLGIQKAIEIIPDLIISDIRMPEKSGIELCNYLKKDERTNHIPIILLTAGTEEQVELLSLKSGADDFIKKPFNVKALEIKVDNIIKSRKALRERYSQEYILKPTDISLTSTDEVFLNKLQKIIDAEFANPDFNAVAFSKKIGMSRMQLHRKLLAYTGLTTTAFIRSQRVKQALEILRNSDATINEVAYTVGFNTPSYFIKCFKEIYKKPPSEYLQYIDK